MRILVLTPTFLPALGGAELVILQVYRRLSANHSVRIITPHLPDSLINNSGSNEYNHYINFEIVHYQDHFTFMKVRGHKISCGIIPPFSLSAINALQKEIRTFHPDVINVHYVMPTGLAGIYAQKIEKVPVVITYNGRDVPGPGVPLLWKFWHRLIGSNCSAMTFVSGYCREAIYGSGYNRSSVIYNGVDKPVKVSIALIRKIKAKFNISDNQRVIFALQRLDPLKRVDILIQSMPKILQRHPETRLIIGGKGSDLTRLKNVVDDLNIADHVHFAGYIAKNELPAYFTMADLCAFHSAYETFGMVLAEAMIYAKAIVSVSNTAISEVVDDGKTGLLVPTYNYEAFADAVLQLLDNDERRNEMGRNGYKKCQKLFRWDAIALQYENVLKFAVNSKHKSK